MAIGQTPDHLFPDGTEVHLLSDAAARAAIADDSADPYFGKLTLLEIAIKRGKPLESADVERERVAFREFVQSCVRPWTAEEKVRMITALASAHERMAKVAPSLIPRQWRFIKTNGRDDLGPHTRGGCIILHERYLAAPMREHLLIHETIHVFSRAHPEVRHRLYEAIGFRHLDCLELPADLQHRLITNPDCTDVGYAIRVKNAKGEEIDAVLMIYSKHAELQPELRMPLAYVQFALFEVRKSETCWRVLTTDEAGFGGLAPRRADGFFDQVGWNTQYLIHPEEIMAENVTLLVRSRSGDRTATVSSPAVLAKIEQVLKTDSPPAE